MVAKLAIRKPAPSGAYVVSSTVGEKVRAFVPATLPPRDLSVSAETRREMENALIALGRLDSAGSILPDKELFLYLYVRKEAVLSSQIEGTESSLADLLLYEAKEAPGVPLDDVQEVSSYVAAMQYGIKRLDGGFPLSNRLIREIHKVLMTSARGSTKSPGEFRVTQNWIGGTRPGNAHFVPPPPDRVPECMGELEFFLHNKRGAFGILEKAALSHVQFETIHPFLDGNGRLGRLLITLLLKHEEVLKDPLLYLSFYFNTHRTEYYERLDRVRSHGDWEGWISFFSKAVTSVADDAAKTATSLSNLVKKHRAQINTLGRKAGSVLRVFEALAQKPLIHIHEIVEFTGLVPNTVAVCLKELQKIKIVAEVTGKSRNRLFSYQKFMDTMDRGAGGT